MTSLARWVVASASPLFDPNVLNGSVTQCVPRIFEFQVFLYKESDRYSSLFTIASVAGDHLPNYIPSEVDPLRLKKDKWY